MKSGETEGFVGWLFSGFAFLALPLILWNALTRDWSGMLINAMFAAMGIFVARRAFKERASLRRASETATDAGDDAGG